MTIETRLEEVRSEYMRRMTRGRSDLLRQAERHFASLPGKMLRPRLTLLAAATLGDDCLASRRTLLLATSVEMLHNASLLHDDVVDRAPTRRGQPTVNVRWGNGVAVLVGDYCLAQIMQLLSETDDEEASRRVNRTVMDMVEAELLAQEVGAKPSEEDYLAIIDGKTARLFATACAFGNPDYEEYGLHFGRLFQLRDDMADGEANPFTADLIARERALLDAMPQLPLPLQ